MDINELVKLLQDGKVSVDVSGTLNLKLIDDGDTPSPTPGPEPAPTPEPTPEPEPINQYTKRPFSATSPWNTKIPESASYGPRKIFVDGTNNDEVWINNDTYGIALYITDPSKEAVTISYQGGYNVVKDGQVTLRVGADMRPPFGSDGTVTIIDPPTNKIWDLYQLRGDGTIRTATRGVSHPLNGSGIGDPNAGGNGIPGPAGIRAAWASASGGLLRGWHFDEGEVINTALAISLRTTDLKHPWVYPVAVSEDSGGASTYVGTIPMGTRLAVRPDQAIEDKMTSDIGRRVLQAAKEYGFFVVDRHTGSAVIILYSTPTEVTAADLKPLRAWWENPDLTIIKNNLRVVDWI